MSLLRGRAAASKDGLLLPTPSPGAPALLGLCPRPRPQLQEDPPGASGAEGGRGSREARAEQYFDSLEQFQFFS